MITALIPQPVHHHPLVTSCRVLGRRSSMSGIQNSGKRI
jgi:hypothetical protein